MERNEIFKTTLIAVGTCFGVLLLVVGLLWAVHIGNERQAEREQAEAAQAAAEAAASKAKWDKVWSEIFREPTPEEKERQRQWRAQADADYRRFQKEQDQRDLQERVNRSKPNNMPWMQ